MSMVQFLLPCSSLLFGLLYQSGLSLSCFCITGTVCYTMKVCFIFVQHFYAEIFRTDILIVILLSFPSVGRLLNMTILLYYIIIVMFFMWLIPCISSFEHVEFVWVVSSAAVAWVQQYYCMILSWRPARSFLSLWIASTLQHQLSSWHIIIIMSRHNVNRSEQLQAHFLLHSLRILS